MLHVSGGGIVEFIHDTGSRVWVQRVHELRELESECRGVAGAGVGVAVGGAA